MAIVPPLYSRNHMECEMKKNTIRIIIVIVLIAATIFYWRYRQSHPTYAWRTAPAQNKNITVNITATGTINPITQVNIGTEVSGKIAKLYKDFNDTVKKGDLLARLDTSTLEMALEEAKIELRKSELSANENLIDLNVTQELYDQNMTAQYELQRAQYTYDVALENIAKAKYNVQRAQTNLNNAIIYSPIAGVIISRAVDEGQTVAASLNAPTLFIIANSLDEMQIEAQIDEADIGKVKIDMRARFSIDAFPDRNFYGRVRQIRLNPIVEQNVVTYKVIISLNNPNRVIMPGMTANVEIIIDQKTDVLTISERALQFRPSKEVWEAFKLPWDESLATTSRGRQRGNGEGRPSGTPSGEQTGEPVRRRGEVETEPPAVQKATVWLLEDGIPSQITIEVGISDGTNIEVISGLSEGTEVIVGVDDTSNKSTATSAFGSSGGGMRMMMR